MKSYLKINIYNGKGGFSNILIIKDMETREQEAFFNNNGYSLSQESKNAILNDGVNPFNILEFNLSLNQAKKVLHNLFIDYKKIKKEQNKGE